MNNTPRLWLLSTRQSAQHICQLRTAYTYTQVQTAALQSVIKMYHDNMLSGHLTVFHPHEAFFWHKQVIYVYICI